MKRIDHRLLSPSLASHKTLTSLHYGQASSGKKIYIQASLHAEELPGMLVAHHLRAWLEVADAAQRIQGEVILVPVANPIGLAQRMNHKPMGRFEMDTGENFNRNYPELAAAIWPTVRAQLGADAQHNVRIVRQAIGDYLAQWNPPSELESLRKTLLSLSYDADMVLDLHCDCESVIHLYCEEACWSAVEPVAQFLACKTALLAKDSGGNPFDECLSGVWWRLAEMLQAEGLASPLPQGCNSTTIELRGELDVHHRWAQADAHAIAQYLQWLGVVRSEDGASVTPPPLSCQATPLSGSQTLFAPAPGVIAYAVEPGAVVAVGDLVVEVIDPIEQKTHRVLAEVAGVFYARINYRYVHTGGELGKIAGATPFRSGKLLGA